MKDCSHLIRKKIFDALDGNVVISGSLYPVYNVIPGNVVYPYIYIYSLGNDSIEDNKSKFISEITTRIEVVTAFDTNTGGQLNCNKAVNAITEILISKTTFFDLSSDDFNVYNAINNGITYLTEDTETQTIYKGVLSFQNSVEQTS